ncbi:hypothetical protein HXX76_001951 [Chlamydomonas incerta]|uniref:RING-type E3 ubiquitin transferase n=1 Tax=Chlamydomonas incerta TaxID=51695 RepID=A0A836AZW8_CHLIN|nr:hypothetical protein HXX76_001951 [Chlamydomonas incerta]|eukprot:KAG2443600.1 hypothetical protein HXX76_001951 [Chlamydomonas incerta]
MWKESAAVLRLFEARSAQKPETLGDTGAAVQKYLGEAEAFLTQHDVEMPDVAISQEAFAAAALANVPLEDIMLGIGAGARQGIDAHYDDTGPILDDEDRRRRIEGSAGASTAPVAAAAAAAAAAATAATAAAAPPAATATATATGASTGTADGTTPGTTGAGTGTEDGQAQGQGQGQGGEGAAAGGEADGGAAGGEGAGGAAGPRTRSQQRADMQAAILEGIQAVYSGMSAIARGTEVIERELDAVLAALQSRNAAAAAASSRPPASRRVVASLPRIKLDEETLENIGRDSQCSVCTETLAAGDEVQLLPCKHAYHPDCLKPWLEQNNSCPLCRKELPTDDARYEAKKEREAEEAAERAGAANALSHNEFAYI